MDSVSKTEGNLILLSLRPKEKYICHLCRSVFLSFIPKHLSSKWSGKQALAQFWQPCVLHKQVVILYGFYDTELRLNSLSLWTSYIPYTAI